MHWLYLLPIILTVIPFVSTAYAQEIVIINQTDPCFLNYTAGLDMWENCGADDDYITWALQPWQWITGGFFSMILVSLFCMFSYIKYHKAVYPLIIGLAYLPIAYALFPNTLLIWAGIFTAALIMIIIWYAFVRQTKEF